MSSLPAFQVSLVIGRPRTALRGSPFSATIVPRHNYLTPSAVLGLPRVFGGRSRSDATVTSVEVPTAAPSPVPAHDAATGWARAHPFRAALIAVFAVSAVRNLIGAAKKARGVKDGTGGATKEAGGAAEVSDAYRESGLRARAVPRRHETTEEAMDLLGNTARKYVIVGGKGGVGKTSSSCAVATQFADRGQVTLIVSSDPAHSLSDSFDQPVGGGEPVPVVGIDNLYAQEIDPDKAKEGFGLGMGGGGGGAMAGLGDMGLDELSSLFDTLPPGFDEAVALVEIVKLLEGDPAYQKFDRVVVSYALLFWHLGGHVQSCV